MKNPFSKLLRPKGEFPSEAEPTSFGRGLAIGLSIAFLILIIVLLAIYFIQNKGGSKDGSSGVKNAKLELTIITKNECTDCWDVNLLLDALHQNGITETKKATVNIEDKKGKDLVEKYKITKVPTIIITGDLEAKAEWKEIWGALGEIIDGTFVFRQVIPPYFDIASGQIKGKVNVTYLGDSSCKECYDVRTHEQALQQLGITDKNSKSVDISSAEGKDLVKKYAITVVPTIIITGEMSEYQGLTQIWPNYGTINKTDGAYIFTKLDAMGTYKDLAKNKVIKVDLTQTVSTTAPAVK